MLFYSVKNFTTRCEGLSPALFVFAITGNLTYAWSICAASMERDYLITNGSWLAGESEPGEPPALASHMRSMLTLAFRKCAHRIPRLFRENITLHNRTVKAASNFFSYRLCANSYIIVRQIESRREAAWNRRHRRLSRGGSCRKRRSTLRLL